MHEYIDEIKILDHPYKQPMTASKSYNAIERSLHRPETTDNKYPNSFDLFKDSHSSKFHIETRGKSNDKENMEVA